MINIFNEQDTVALDLTAIEQDIAKLLKLLDYEDFDINIMFATDEVIHHHNKAYRDKDKLTDILSFPFYPDVKAGERIHAESDEEKILGDIIIAPQYVQDDLQRWGVSFKRRIQELMVHGLLHILGYDHIKDKDYEVMKEKEEWLLQQL